MPRIVLFLFLTVMVPAIVRGAIVVPTAADARFGWNRGAANSAYSGWDVFDPSTSPPDFISDTSPELPLSQGPSNQLASIVPLVSGSIVSSSSHIYALGGPGSFSVNIPVFTLPGESLTTLVAQFRFVGNATLPQLSQSLMLNGVVAQQTEVLFTGLVPGPFGEEQTLEYLARWQISNASSPLQMTFATSQHSGLDQLHIDSFVTAVPEPGSLAMFAGLGVLGIAARYRRDKARFTSRQLESCVDSV